MSELCWVSRCPTCQGRFTLERHVTARTSTLPERQETTVTRWSVECANGHQFVLAMARAGRGGHEYRVVIE